MPHDQATTPPDESQPPAAAVPGWIRSLAERHGERTLVVLDDRRLGYREAERASGRLALGLLAAGVGKGARVGILLPNGPDWVVAWLAAARVGAIAVPINTFYQARELGWILRHADVQTLLTASGFLSHDYLERLEKAAPALAGQDPGRLCVPELPFLRSVFVFGRGERSWCEPAAALEQRGRETVGFDEAFLRAVESEVTPADPMAILYSSGSTSDPKGAVHTHGSVLRHAARLNAYRDLSERDRIYSPMPFFWVGGFVFSLVSAMQAGARLLCEESFEPGRTLDLIERERATLVAGWPHFAKALAEHPSVASRDLSAIRGGNLYAVLPEELRPRDPELRSNSLGMTETCGPHTMGRMDEDLPEALRGSFGRAVPGVEHKIVDPETGETLPAGREGEICVRGASLMRDLYKLEREEVFDADGFYHTGDAGRFDADGHLFFCGRLGELIKTGGANVTPREVEAVLESYPEVKEAYVVGLPDPDRGQVVAAAVVLQPGSRVGAAELRRRLKGELSAYKVPRQVTLHEHDELPFTDTGKLDKRALASRLAG